MRIKEFRNSEGRLLSASEIGDMYAIETSGAQFVNKIIMSCEESACKNNLFLSEDIIYKTYDICVAKSHADEIELKEYVTMYSEQLAASEIIDMCKVAEIYYALENGVKHDEICNMIVCGKSHDNMREIRLGYEAGLGNNVNIYASIKNVNMQASLRKGLMRNIPSELIKQMSTAHCFSTVVLICMNYRKGLDKEDITYFLDAENRILEMRNKNPVNKKLPAEFSHLPGDENILQCYDELTYFINLRLNTSLEFIKPDFDKYLECLRENPEFKLIQKKHKMM